MNYEIPLPLKQEHEELHEQLRQATQVGGEVGELAKTLARLMHPHFLKEDQLALPPLGLLVALASGDATPEMAGVLTLTDQLEAELPAMLAEHQIIVAALQRLRDAAQRAGRTEIIDFAQQLMRHARTEEEVMYPAAILVGKFVRQRLGQSTRASR
ncbi:MAG TPA: hemerythrin domain-containing protein [Burkholderiaceae bacterium]